MKSDCPGVSNYEREVLGIINIVDKLQSELEDQCPEEYYFIEFTTDGNDICVRFLGIPIWFREDDMREYDEERDEYEPLENYLRREINNEIEKISKLRF